MRVLTSSLCYPSDAHGEHGVFIQRRASALADREVDVQVVSPQPYCPLLRRWQPVADRRAPLPAVYPRMFSVPVLGWATDGLAYARVLEQYIRDRGGPEYFDLIDSHFEYPDGVGAWLAGRKLGLPVCVTVRGKIVTLSRKALRRMQIARMLRGVDARITVSSSLAEWVRRISGSDLSVDVIPNGVETATFHPLDRQHARNLLGWDGGVQYLLAVGHLQRIKGFDRIVSIMPELRARLGDVRLVLAGSMRGERSFRWQLQRLIATCGGSPAVAFTGPVDAERLNLMYNAADVFVNVSRSEGWNNAIAEALAAGTPVVAGDVGGNAEQLLSPRLGSIVPDGDPHALADAIDQALQTDWNRTLIAAHGGARTWGQVAREVQSVFNRVLEAHSVTTPQAVRLFGTAVNTAELALTGRPALEVNQ